LSKKGDREIMEFSTAKEIETQKIIKYEEALNREAAEHREVSRLVDLTHKLAKDVKNRGAQNRLHSLAQDIDEFAWKYYEQFRTLVQRHVPTVQDQVAAINKYNPHLKSHLDKNTYTALSEAIHSNAMGHDSTPKAKTMDQLRDEQVNAINKYNPHKGA
jgi:hypothetical protein